MTYSTIAEELLKQLDQLPLESQKKVLEFARALNAVNLKGKPGKDLLKYAGTIDQDILKVMEKAVEYGCERVETLDCEKMNALKIKAYELIDCLPDEKLAKVLIILENLKDITNDDLPDDWDLQLVKEAQEAERTGEFISLDDVARELGFDAGKLQGNH